MNYFNNCTTLDEAKKAYYQLAMLHHPDRGGNAETFKVVNNQFQAFKPSTLKYENEVSDWSATEYAEIIEALLKIQGIKIEICGSWVWIDGDTKPVKDQIKAVANDQFKVGFSANKCKWYVSPAGYKKFTKKTVSMDTIRNVYGSTNIFRDNRNQLRG